MAAPGTVTTTADGKATFTTHCTWCDKPSELTGLDLAALAAYRNREDSVQALFPQLSAAEREILMTGTHPACWNEMFPPDEEDDPDDFPEYELP
jgi:hypothetical protein